MYAIVLAGGIGSRLWPLSRELYPKQFLKVDGEYSLLQQTLKRINNVVPALNTIIVTNNYHVENIKLQINQIFERERPVILKEPVGKNTAPAIAYGLFYIKQVEQKKNGDDIVIVLPSDHLIKNNEEFIKVVKMAAKIAAQGYLVTFGIKPDRPETGYGYIKKGSEEIGEGAFMVEKFVEKPNLSTAQEYMRNDRFYWNSGIFVFKLSIILQKYKTLLPNIYNSITTVNFLNIMDKQNEEALKEIFDNLEEVSIDIGIFEKSSNVAVIPVDIGWDDIGNWHFMFKSLPKDNYNNVTQGDTILLDSHDSLIFSEGKLTAAIGLENMIVVNTNDALLICPQERSQEVKKVVDILKERHAEEFHIHTKVEKPWGHYSILGKGPRYKIKRLEVKPGERLSGQMHHHRTEHWIVVAGTAKITKGEETFYLHTNESTYIPMSTIHRLENPGLVPLEVIEVQNGEYIEEDDIIRFEDDYDRNDVQGNI